MPIERQKRLESFRVNQQILIKYTLLKTVSKECEEFIALNKLTARKMATSPGNNLVTPEAM